MSINIYIISPHVWQISVLRLLNGRFPWTPFKFCRNWIKSALLKATTDKTKKTNIRIRTILKTIRRKNVRYVCMFFYLQYNFAGQQRNITLNSKNSASYKENRTKSLEFTNHKRVVHMHWFSINFTDIGEWI